MKIEIEETEFQRLLNERSALRAQLDRATSDLAEAKRLLAQIHSLTRPPAHVTALSSVTITSTDWEGRAMSGLVAVGQ